VPIPYAVTRWNRDVFNRATVPILRRLPGFGVIHHRGRRSGREFQTPVNLFPVPGGFVVALTYGSRTDWLRNVLAAGGCEVETRGRRVRCDRPEVFRDPQRQEIRPVERVILGWLDVEEFLRLHAAAPPSG
jgi:deazaflavin-dependent oxidoreductase (nitroreductase family)